MKEFWLHACPRCGGDLYAIEDVEAAFVACFQCGHVVSVVDEATLRTTRQLPMAYPPVQSGAA